MHALLPHLPCSLRVLPDAPPGECDLPSAQKIGPIGVSNISASQLHFVVALAPLACSLRIVSDESAFALEGTLVYLTRLVQALV